MSKDNEQARSRIRAGIEELATCWLLAESSPGEPDSIRTAIGALGEQAAEAGFPECARKAEALAGGEESLREGLAALQQVFESESHPSVTAVPTAVNPLAEDPELLSDFILEAREHLVSIEAQSLVLEQDAANAEAVHSVFRSFHTIKIGRAHV